MADNRIKIVIGGEYTLKDRWNDLNTDIKDSQKKFRDFSKSGQRVLGELAGTFDGELAGAIQGTSGLLTSLATGGVFGMVSAGIQLVAKGVGKLVDVYRETKQLEKDIAAIRTREETKAISGVAAEYERLNALVEKNILGVKELKSIDLQGAALDAEMQIQKLHTETLQRITDDMTAEAKAVIEAEEQVKRVAIERAAAIERESAASEEAVKLGTVARLKLKDAQDRLRQAQEEEEKFSKENAGVYAGRIHGGYLLLNAEKNHKEELAKIDAILKERELAEKALAAAQKELDIATATEAKVRKEQAVAAIKRENAAIEAEQRLNAAKEKERAAAERVAAAKAAEYEASVRYEMRAQIEEKISQVCTKQKLDQAKFLEILNQAMQDGCEETQTYVRLQQELDEQLKRRADAEKAAADSTEAGNAKAAKGGVIVNAGASHITVDVSNIERAIDGSRRFQDYERAQREEARAARDDYAQNMRDQSAMFEYLRGDMPKERARLFEDYLMSKTPKKITDLGAAAMKAQLLSKAEALAQKRTVEKILERVQEALTVR